MKRPHLFWVTFTGGIAGTFAVIDLWADGNDVEGDTWSEGFRCLRIPDWLLATGLAASSVGAFFHLRQRLEAPAVS